MLEEEGVKVEDHRVVDFDRLSWHPRVLGMDYEINIE